jgi:hypothetical protein
LLHADMTTVGVMSGWSRLHDHIGSTKFQVSTVVCSSGAGRRATDINERAT